MEEYQNKIINLRQKYGKFSFFFIKFLKMSKKQINQKVTFII